jgi:ABC-type multidrug transport system ATPase subunit/pSer/pThr/pTyr-binding forkhead associated (FHA) protein
LFLFRDGHLEREFTLSDGESLAIGQPGHDTGLELEDRFISRRHCLLNASGGTITIQDLSSSNGTHVNGTRLHEAPVQLKEGDLVTFGKESNYRLQVGVATAPPPASAAPKALGELLRTKSQVTIGRDKGCDIVIRSLAVSRQHVRVSRTNGGYTVEDLDSTNGTFVNGQRIRGTTSLGPSDTVAIGPMSYTLDAMPTDLRQHTAIVAENVEKTYPNGNIGLRPTAIKIRAREFVAVMGPSGCGKSTLLKALNGDNPASSGTVYVHGLELREHFDRLKRNIGYVPQDDIVHRELTVEQSLYYAAKLRLASDVTRAEIDARIDEVLSSLNINDQHTRSQRISSLSGGQRKRVSIAVELLNEPSILFLDEPTSPLDPETIDEFLKCIKRLAERVTTIVMVTHKPEDLQYVDKVIFLATGGYLVFLGERKRILDYFDKTSIVEIYALLSDRSKGTDWYNKWIGENPLSVIETKPHPIKRSRRESFLRQTLWLSRRYFNIKWNDKANLMLLLAQPVIVALLLSAIFMFVQNGTLFMMALSAIWFGASNAAREIVDELPIYRRERLFNLRIGPYLTSKLIVLGLIAFVQIVVYVAIMEIRYMDTRMPLGSFWQSVGFMFYLSLVSTFLGLLISAIFRTAEQVITIVPIVLLPQIMLSGAVNRINSQFIEIVSYGTLGRWGMEGLARIQDMNSPMGAGVVFGYPGSEPSQAPPVSALEVLDFYRPELLGWFDSLPLNFIVITAMGILFLSALVFAMKRKDTI